MNDKKAEIVAYNLFGWETALTTEQPGHIIFSVMFAATEEQRKAGKLTKLRLLLSQKRALELSLDLKKAARAPATGPRVHH